MKFIPETIRSGEDLELDQDIRGVAILWDTAEKTPRIVVIGGTSPWEAAGLASSAATQLQQFADEYVLLDGEELEDEEDEDDPE